MELEVGQEANADLDSIFDYGADMFGVEAADAYVRQFGTAFALLREHPFAGPENDRVRPPIRSLSCGSHRIYYDVVSDRVMVRRVLHKATDVERHL